MLTHVTKIYQKKYPEIFRKNKVFSKVLGGGFE